MRTMTNSAGLTGATPISTITIPASIDSAVLFVPSHLTKNACSGLANRPTDTAPEAVVVWLEYAPLRTLQDRLFKVVEVAANVDVSPLCITGEGTCSPNPNTAPREGLDCVNAFWVQQVGLTTGRVNFDADHPLEHLICRCLEHAASVVVVVPQTGDVTTWGEVNVVTDSWVKDGNPGPVGDGKL